MKGQRLDELEKMCETTIEYQGELEELPVTQRMLLRKTLEPLIISKIQENKWAVVALGRVSLYDTKEKAKEICQSLPVVASIIPPPGGEFEPEPGWEIATITYEDK